MNYSTRRSIKNIGKSMSIYANKGNGKYYKEYKENGTFHDTWKYDVLYDFICNIISLFFVLLFFAPIIISFLCISIGNLLNLKNCEYFFDFANCITMSIIFFSLSFLATLPIFYIVRELIYNYKCIKIFNINLLENIKLRLSKDKIEFKFKPIFSIWLVAILFILFPYLFKILLPHLYISIFLDLLKKTKFGIKQKTIAKRQ